MISLGLSGLLKEWKEDNMPKIEMDLPEGWGLRQSLPDSKGDCLWRLVDIRNPFCSICLAEYETEPSKETLLAAIKSYEEGR